MGRRGAARVQTVEATLSRTGTFLDPVGRMPSRALWGVVLCLVAGCVSPVQTESRLGRLGSDLGVPGAPVPVEVSLLPWRTGLPPLQTEPDGSLPLLDSSAPLSTAVDDSVMDGGALLVPYSDEEGALALRVMDAPPLAEGDVGGAAGVVAVLAAPAMVVSTPMLVVGVGVIVVSFAIYVTVQNPDAAVSLMASVRRWVVRDNAHVEPAVRARDATADDPCPALIQWGGTTRAMSAGQGGRFALTAFACASPARAYVTPSVAEARMGYAARRYDHDGTMVVTLQNVGPQPVTLVLQQNAFGGGGEVPVGVVLPQMNGVFELPLSPRYWNSLQIRPPMQSGKFASIDFGIPEARPAGW
jgi:hypothetical protein